MRLRERKKRQLFVEINKKTSLFTHCRLHDTCDQFVRFSYVKLKKNVERTLWVTRFTLTNLLCSRENTVTIMVKISLEKRYRIVFLKEQGHSASSIGKMMKVSRHSVSEIVQKHKETGTVNDRVRSGRPAMTSQREDRQLVRTSLQDPKLTAVDISRDFKINDRKHGEVAPSVWTVRRRLRKAGLCGRVARKKPFLRQVNKVKRLAWAKKHSDWTVEDWKKVVWSDESPFTIFRTTGKTYVRRREGEAYKASCIVPTVKHGGGKLMVWGCFRWNQTGKLHWIKETMDQHVYATSSSTIFCRRSKSWPSLVLSRTSLCSKTTTRNTPRKAALRRLPVCFRTEWLGCHSLRT
jgi:transposase